MDGTDGCDGYILATPAATADDHELIAVGRSGGFYGCPVANFYGIGGLRPVICLKRSVKFKKNNENSTLGKIVYDLISQD